jgi:hypothetical protein
MGIQEIITFLIVGLAVFITGRTFFRQFHRDENAPSKCAKCALNRLKVQKVHHSK